MKRAHAPLEPTYEGLKRLQQKYPLAPLRALEPTYEGLKQPHAGDVRKEVLQLWSLPMRD